MAEGGADWPKHGPDFNRWNGDLLRLATMIADASGEYWWCADNALKYLVIRIDTRDGGFVLRDRDNNPIEPERVEAAIAKWRKQTGGIKLRSSASPPPGGSNG